MYPGLLEHYIPIRTTPDGHCIFRSSSWALFGMESRHVDLRLLCVAMFIRHRAFFEHFRTAFTERANIAETIHHTAFVSCSGQNGWGDGCHLQAIAIGSRRRLYRFRELSGSDGRSLNNEQVPIKREIHIPTYVL